MNNFTEKQEKDIIFFKNSLSDFLTNDLLKHKFVVISNEKLQKSFDTLQSALEYAVENFNKGDYIIQQIIDDKEVINFARAVIV